MIAEDHRIKREGKKGKRLKVKGIDQSRAVESVGRKEKREKREAHGVIRIDA